MSERDDGSSLGMVYLLKCAELAVRGCAESVLARHRLTPASFLLLFRLKDSAGASSAELARALGVRPQSVVELLRPLERSRLIRRRRDPAHGRILRISLTPAGERLLARAVPAARRLEEELFDPLGTQRLRELRTTLGALLEGARTHDSLPPPRTRRARAPG